MVALGDHPNRITVCPTVSLQLILQKNRHPEDTMEIMGTMGKYLLWHLFKEIPQWLQQWFGFILMTIIAFLLVAGAYNYFKAAKKKGASHFASKMIKLLEKYQTPDVDEATAAKRIIQCPKCSQNLRVPSRSNSLRVKCPKCNESFIWG
jgi:hypothetical protein